MSEKYKRLIAERLQRRIYGVSNIDLNTYADGILFNWHNQKYRTNGFTVSDIGRDGKPYDFDTPQSILIAAIIRQPNWSKTP